MYYTKITGNFRACADSGYQALFFPRPSHKEKESLGTRLPLPLPACMLNFLYFSALPSLHFSEKVFTLVSLVFTVCKHTGFRAEFYLPCIPMRIASKTPISCLVRILLTEYNSGSSCLEQLVVQRNGHKGATLVAKQRDEPQPRQNF